MSIKVELPARFGHTEEELAFAAQIKSWFQDSDIASDLSVGFMENRQKKLMIQKMR